MVKSFGRALGLGFLVWLVPFVGAVLVFPFHEPRRALFESIMAVTVCAVAICFGLLYFKKLPEVTVRDGVALGILWWAMCVIIDLPLMSAGPMAMSLAEYFADIGLTYVVIPIITIGLAFAFSRSSHPDTHLTT